MLTHSDELIAIVMWIVHNTNSGSHGDGVRLSVIVRGKDKVTASGIQSVAHSQSVTVSQYEYTRIKVNIYVIV